MRTELSLSDIEPRSSIQIALSLLPAATLTIGDTEYLNIIRMIENPLCNHTPCSLVAIAPGYGLDDRGVGFRVPIVSRIFFSPQRPDRLWGPPSPLSNGYRRFFLRGVKRQWRETDYSPPISAELKKMWIYISTPPYTLME
jgi:hypothetical protein